MKKISILCLTLLSALTMLVGCKADPEAIDNTPEVYADEASELLRTSAVLTGRIMAPAKASIKEYGFLLSSSSDFSSSDTQTIKCDENLKEFSAQVTDLEIGGTYFYAAYATNGLDRMTSTVRAFTTPNRSGVLLTDLKLEDEKRATFSARVADTGGGEIHAVGLCWAADKTPTTYDKTILTELNADNTFSASLTGLEAGKTYYVRAFADSDILGDGTTQTISYSRDVVEIRLEEAIKEEPSISVEALSSTTTTITCRITTTAVDQVRWMVVYEEAMEVYGEIWPELVFQGDYEIEPNTTVELTAPNLVPATTYYVFVAAKAGEEYLIGEPAIIATQPEEIDPELTKIYYTSTDGNIVEPNDTTVFGANIVSNTYENGQGVILFDGPVTEIGYIAFSECNTLESITIPNGVTSISSWALSYCSSLTSITISNSVTSIGVDAFMGCTSLTSITIPDSVVSVGAQAFMDCLSLTAFYGKLASDDNRCLVVDGELNAFAIGCGATEYTVPDNVTSIGWDAFSRCTSLTSITIPNSVASIVRNPFINCESLTAFYGKFASEDNRCLVVDGVLKVFAPTGVTSYLIPNSVSSIGEQSFMYCSSLSSVTIPDSVTSIGESAFAGCSSLTSLYCYPATPPSGDSSMFKWYYSELKIYVPNASVEAYKSAPGWSDYADYIYPMDPVEDEVPETWKIYYTTTDGEIISSFSNPSGLNLVSNSYENGRGVITFDGVITEIPGSFMYGEKTLKSIVLPGAVTRIGSEAFEMCTALESVTLPEGVAKIGQMAFAYTALRELILPESVTEIDNDAFHNCSSLESVTLSGSPEVRSDAFTGCSSISSVHITSLEAWCKCDFGGWAYLMYSASNPCSYGATLYLNGVPVTEVTIPQGVTALSDGAFAGCGSLLQITIPEHVTEIGSRCFNACENLETVYCLSTTPATPKPQIFPGTYGNQYDWNPFTNLLETFKIYVPYASLETYRTAWLWSRYADYIYPMDVEEIPETWKIDYTSTDGKVVEPHDPNVFEVNIVLNTYENGQGMILFDGPVTSIGNFAFHSCSSLTSITIPNSVTSIEYGAFCWCSGLTNVTIPNSVTEIGDEAFYGCTGLTAFYGKFASSDNRCLIVEDGTLKAFAPAGLTSYSIPDSVTSIGEGVFTNCSGLTSITIPDSVTSIEDHEFDGCTGLTSVYCKPTTPPTGSYCMFDNNASGRKIYVPNASVDAYKAAEYWSDYTDSIFPMDPVEDEVPETWKIYYTSTDGNIVKPYATVFGANIVSNTYENGQGVILFDGPVTSIGLRAFQYCTGLASITIPNGVTSIVNYAFYECTGLTSVIIPNSVTSIEYGAFQYCAGLSSVTIPDSVTSIGGAAFYDCDGLTNVTIPDSVTSIGELAFWNCTSLKSITIPDSVTSIEYSVFRDCTGLTSITIPDSVTSIGDCVFEGCTGLTSVIIPDSVISIGNSIFYNCTGLTGITIPDGVSSIGNWAFRNCTSLTSITIPDSVTSIGEYAFEECTSLTSITIPNSVTSIGKYAFSGCTGLTSVTIPDSVTSIGDVAFYDCDGLTSVTIGNGLTSIGEQAFDSCNALTSVYCYPATPPAGNYSMFMYNAPDRKIYVPNTSVDVYKAAEYWSDYAADIVGYDF